MEKSEELLFYTYRYFCNFIYQGFHQCPNIEEFYKFIQYLNFVKMSKIYKGDILEFEKDLKANKMNILTTTSTTSMSSSLSKTTNVSQNNNPTLVNKKNFTLNTKTKDVTKNNFKIKSLDIELNRYANNSISRKIKTITTSTTTSNSHSKNIIKPSSKMVEEKPIEPATSASAAVVVNNTFAYTTTKTGGDTFDAAAITKDKRTILSAASENKNKITPFRKCLKDNNETKLYSKCIYKEKRVNNNNRKIKVDEMENVEQQRDDEELVGAVGGGSRVVLEPKVVMEESDGQTGIKENLANSESNNCKNNHNSNFENQLMRNRMINSFQHCDPYGNNSNMNNYTSTQPIVPNGFINNGNNYTNAQRYQNNIPMRFPLSTMRFQYNPSTNQARQHNIKYQQYHNQPTWQQQQQQQQQQLPNQQKTTNQQKKSFNTSSCAGISLQMPPPSIKLLQAPPPLPPPIQPPTFYYPNCYSNYEYYDQNNINENNYYNMYNNHGYYPGMWCHPNVPNPPLLHNANGAATTYHNNPDNNHYHTQSTFRENCYKTPTSNNTTYHNKQVLPQKHNIMLDEDKSTTSPNNTTSTSENEDFNVNQRKTNTDVDTNLIEENQKKCSSILENSVESHLMKCEKDTTNCEKLKTKSTIGESSSAVAAAKISSSKASSSKEFSSSKESSSSLSPYETSKRIYVGRTNNNGTTFFNGERKDEVTHFSTRYIIDTIVELKKDIAELQSSLGIIKY